MADKLLSRVSVDDLLWTAAFGAGGHAVWSALNANSYNDTFYGPVRSIASNSVQGRWYSHSQAMLAAITAAVAASKGSPEAKKNALLANGAAFATAAVHQGVNIKRNRQADSGFTWAHVAALGAVGAISIAKGGQGRR